MQRSRHGARRRRRAKPAFSASAMRRQRGSPCGSSACAPRAPPVARRATPESFTRWC